jgi:hypothetical protein
VSEKWVEVYRVLLLSLKISWVLFKWRTLQSFHGYMEESVHRSVIWSKQQTIALNISFAFGNEGIITKTTAMWDHWKMALRLQPVSVLPSTTFDIILQISFWNILMVLWMYLFVSLFCRASRSKKMWRWSINYFLT